MTAVSQHQFAASQPLYAANQHRHQFAANQLPHRLAVRLLRQHATRVTRAAPQHQAVAAKRLRLVVVAARRFPAVDVLLLLRAVDVQLRLAADAAAVAWLTLVAALVVAP